MDQPRVTLRRYTRLAPLLHLLQTGRFTMLDASRWDDRNDAHFLELYKLHKKCGSVLAACFAQTAETYHHWRVFSHGDDGVCIEFNRQLLEAQLERHGVKCADVDYRTIDQLRAKPLTVDELPFVKRFPYRDECEFRAVFETGDPKCTSKEFEIDLSCLTRINLSPWMHESLSNFVKLVLEKLVENASVDLNRSQLISYQRWKDAAERHLPALDHTNSGTSAT